MTPGLEAEAERLLSLRTRDIRFSPEMLQAYREKTWPQRSKIARAWMVWVALIAIAFIPVSYLLAPESLQAAILISGFLVPAMHACAYPVWRKPRSDAVEGLSVVLLMVGVTTAYNYLSVITGGNGYGRFLSDIVFWNAIAIMVFNVSYRWTVALMVCTVANLLCFEVLNPTATYKEAIGFTIFYVIGLFAATAARKTQSLLAQKTFLMSLRDQYQRAQLEILATRDPLTGLPNRRAAASLIDRLWNDRRIAKTSVAFVMADIDSFKQLNDSAGHAAGDACIQRVARAIEQSVRLGDDAVCRYGGEEFLIVLTDTTPDLTWALAERIRGAVEALDIVNPGVQTSDGSRGVVTISLGIAFAHEGAAPELVAKRADDALYDAKRSGRNVVYMTTDKASTEEGSSMSPETGLPDSRNPHTSVA